MPTLPARAAAYTRTGILRRFLEQLSAAPLPRVDNAYAETRLGLKGGDVRAFLQSLRVLGLTDPYGALTERARRTRSAAQRAEAMREGLEQAYPELFWRWEARGGMPRQEVEDFFKVEYGLSASSAGPAAKLFTDLMVEFGRPTPRRAPEEDRYPGGAGLRSESRRGEGPVPGSGSVAEEGVASGEARPETRAESARPGTRVEEARLDSRFPDVFPDNGVPDARPGTRTGETRPETRMPDARPETRAPVTDARLAALETVRSSLRIDINAEWDEERIRLVFDRLERLVTTILAAGS